jgi:hypothetical protein
MNGIDEVHVDHNGQVYVFDSAGEQMPELQGAFADVYQAVLQAADDNTVFFGWPEDPESALALPQNPLPAVKPPTKPVKYKPQLEEYDKLSPREQQHYYWRHMDRKHRDFTDAAQQTFKFQQRLQWMKLMMRERRLLLKTADEAQKAGRHEEARLLRLRAGKTPVLPVKRLRQ